MSAFACMHFQDASLLEFQKRLREQRQQDNLLTLFKIQKCPESTQLREIIDPIDSQWFRPVFKDYFTRLQRGKHLAKFQLPDGLYYCSLDGTQYFHSETISCPHCLVTNHRSGTTSYTHKMVQAAILHPDCRQVIPLMPEEVKNTDGTAKQDCEINAAKRLIPNLREDHPRLKFLIGGDDLFAHQPFITLLLDHRMHYLLVAKPTSHETLMADVATRTAQIQTRRIPDDEGRIHVYEWLNHVPLNGAKDTLFTNFLRFRIITLDGHGHEKIHYANSWITDQFLSADNVELLVRTGRSHWKIENECFNTLKNQGYHLEHNFGHGQQHLSFTMILLTLLAFFCHQIFELTDPLFQDCRHKFGSKHHLWETLRSYIKIIVFDTWEMLLAFALSPTRYRLVPIAPG